MLFKEKMYLSNCDSVRGLSNDEIRKRFLIGLVFGNGVILSPNILFDTKGLNQVLEQKNVIKFLNEEGYGNFIIRGMNIENINSLDDNVTRAFNMYYLVVSRHEDHNYTDMYIPFIIVTIDNTPYILLNKLSYTMSSNITGNVDNEWNYIKLVDGFVDNLVKNVLLDYTAADNTIIDIINGIRPGKYEFRYPGGDSRYLFILQENGYDPKVIELSKSGIYNNLPIVKFNADGSAIEQILVTDDFSIKSLSLGEYLQSNFKVIIFSATDGYFINNIEKNTVFMLNNTYYSVEDANYTYNDESNKYDLEVSVVKEGESHSFMEYDIMDLELQVILAENFSFGEASKPSMTEDEGDSKLNTNILKGDTRILYNRVKEGAKKLGAMTKKGGSKILKRLVTLLEMQLI